MTNTHTQCDEIRDPAATVHPLLWTPALGMSEAGRLLGTAAGLASWSWTWLPFVPSWAVLHQVIGSLAQVILKVAQSCPTLCDPVDYILQARILEWVTFPFFRGSSQPRDQTQVSHITDGFFTS